MAQQVPRPLRPAETRPAAANKNAEIIEKARFFLVQIGVNPTFFEDETYLLQGYTSALFAKILRPFADAPDVVRCEALLQLGIANGYYAHFIEMSMDEFILFLNFLRSPAGQDAQSKMAKRDRLIRRGGEQFTAQEVARISMFDAQMNDMSNEINDYRKEEEAEIARLEEELLEVRTRMEMNIEEIRNRFCPAGSYTPMKNPKLNRACWAAYTAAKKLTVPLTEQSLSEVVHTYSDVVRKRHIIDFLKKDGFSDRLNAYIIEKIGQFDDSGEERSAKRFRGLLDIVEQPKHKSDRGGKDAGPSRDTTGKK